MADHVGRFQVLAKSAAEWSGADPVLYAGEFGISDAGSSAPILKAGDGVRPWSALPALGGAGGGGSADYVAGDTVTLPPGSDATVDIDNTVDPPTISFGIPAGNTGPANVLTIGTVTTAPPGGAAAASITGSSPAQVLNLTIPTGADGAPGPPNELAIGTVTTGLPGTPADATITGTYPDQVLNLTIPAGNDGIGAPGVPTALVGLVAKPGTTEQYIRSDGAPALDQAIAPVWTGEHKFAGSLTYAIGAAAYAAPGVIGSSPRFGLVVPLEPADNRVWELTALATSKSLRLRALNDAGTVGSTAWLANRNGAIITGIEYGNTTDKPIHSFFGNVAIAPPTSGTALTVNAVANTPAFTFNGQAVAPIGNFISPAAASSYVTFYAGVTAYGDIGSGAATFSPGNAADFGISSRAGRMVLGTGGFARLAIDSAGTVDISAPPTAVPAFVVHGATGAQTADFIGDGGLRILDVSTSRLGFLQTTATDVQLGSYAAAGLGLKLYTSAPGSGATVRLQISPSGRVDYLPDGGAPQEIGFRDLALGANFSASIGLAQTDNGRGLAYLGSGGHSVTLPDLSIGCIVTIINAGSGSLTLQGTGALYWYNGAGTFPPNGARVLALGGVCTLWHRGGGNWNVWGVGLS